MDEQDNQNGVPSTAAASSDAQLKDDGSAGKTKRGTRIRWDEETIAEHNKFRGTRQKIDEPPTPYHVTYDLADSDNDSNSSRRGSMGSGPGTPNMKKAGSQYLAENWDVLTSALEAAATKRGSSTLSSEYGSTSDDAGGGGGLSNSSSCGGAITSMAINGGDRGGGSMDTSGSGSGGHQYHHRASFSSDSEADRVSEEKHLQSPQHEQFAKKRMSHYDEYKRLQEWRKKHQAEEDEEEDDDDIDNNSKTNGGASSSSTAAAGGGGARS